MIEEIVYIEDLCKEIGKIPDDGIISRTIHSDKQLKAVLFGFDKGQELSEHTSSLPAIMHIVRGKARLTLGDKKIDANTGAWVHMTPGLLHSVYAQTPLIMLLLLLKEG